MGRKINRARMTNVFWASPLGIPSYINENLFTNKAATNHSWSFFADSPQEVVHRLLCLLPAQAQIQVLLQFYVSLSIIPAFRHKLIDSNPGPTSGLVR